MKKLNINHEYTPDGLKLLNAKLESELCNESLNDVKLKGLIEQRDSLVIGHLKTLDPHSEKLFAEHELNSNKDLLKVIEEHLSLSLKELSGFLRGKKVLKKYK